MKRYALLGENIEYSLSPLIHSVIYEEYGLEAEYSLMSVDKTRLARAVKTLRNQYDGFNVTKPFKQDIISYLDKDQSGLDSVNTVVCADGKLTGYNTDGYGFSKSAADAFGELGGMSVLVMGAGGVAQTVVPELIKAGASVYVYNRTSDKEKLLCEKTGAVSVSSVFAKGPDGKFGFAPELAVNCTVLGLSDKQNPFALFSDSGLKLAYDTIYRETEFLKQAKKAGAKCEDGLSMLIYQAIKADEIMCGIKVDGRERELKALIEARVKQTKAG